MPYLIIFISKYLILFLIALFLINILISKDGVQTIINFLLVSCISFVTSRLLSYFVFLPRPFEHDGVPALFFHTPNNGFPSDHALLAFTIALTLYKVDKNIGILALILASLIGYARVLANIHHPVDILGSLVIVIFAYFLTNFVKKIQQLKV